MHNTNVLVVVFVKKRRLMMRNITALISRRRTLDSKAKFTRPYQTDHLLNVFLKTVCFSFEFNETWGSLSKHSWFLQLQQFSLNSNEEQKSFLVTHLTDSPSVKGRWIWPKRAFSQKAKSVVVQSHFKIVAWIKQGWSSTALDSA